MSPSAGEVEEERSRRRSVVNACMRCASDSAPFATAPATDAGRVTGGEGVAAAARLAVSAAGRGSGSGARLRHCACLVVMRAAGTGSRVCWSTAQCVQHTDENELVAGFLSASDHAAVVVRSLSVGRRHSGRRSKRRQTNGSSPARPGSMTGQHNDTHTHRLTHRGGARLHRKLKKKKENKSRKKKERRFLGAEISLADHHSDDLNR